jgi:hypothetical protein
MPAPAAAPRMMPTTKAPEPEAEDVEAARPRSWGADSGNSLSTSLRRPVTVSTSTIFLALAGVLIVGILGYAIAFKVGGDKREAKLLRDLNIAGAPVDDPLKNGNIPVNPNLIGDTNRSAQPSQPQAARPDPRRTSPSVVPPAPGPAAIPAAPGSDPRVDGLNYITLASKLDKETSDRAIAFLNKNGLQAFALTVDRDGRVVNNVGSYTLYLQPGITAEEYRARGETRTKLETESARLGKVWQRDHKGQTDFSQVGWQKKKP